MAYVVQFTSMFTNEQPPELYASVRVLYCLPNRAHAQNVSDNDLRQIIHYLIPGAESILLYIENYCISMGYNIHSLRDTYT